MAAILVVLGGGRAFPIPSWRPSLLLSAWKDCVLLVRGTNKGWQAALGTPSVSFPRSSRLASDAMPYSGSLRPGDFGACPASCPRVAASCEKSIACPVCEDIPVRLGF